MVSLTAWDVSNCVYLVEFGLFLLHVRRSVMRFFFSEQEQNSIFETEIMAQIPNKRINKQSNDWTAMHMNDQNDRTLS